jgi:hypothetical protein
VDTTAEPVLDQPQESDCTTPASTDADDIRRKSVSQAAVVVDVGTNLDIFGSSTALMPPPQTAPPPVASNNEVTAQMLDSVTDDCLPPIPTVDVEALASLNPQGTLRLQGLGLVLEVSEQLNDEACASQCPARLENSTEKLNMDATSLPNLHPVAQNEVQSIQAEELDTQIQSAVAEDMEVDEFSSQDMVKDTPTGSPASPEESVTTPEEADCAIIMTEVASDEQNEVHMEVNNETERVPDEATSKELMITAELPGDTASTHNPSTENSSPDEVLSCTPPDQPTHTGEQSNTVVDESEAVPETPPGQRPGFTPINASEVSPQGNSVVTDADTTVQIDKVDADEPNEFAPTEPEDDADDDADDYEEEGVVTAMDYEPTVQMDLTVTAPAAEETLEACRYSMPVHDDSETEMLRKFVTRVKADKSARAAAAAALAKRSLRPKRRSGSTGSITSTTGSPMSKVESPVKRLPLGEKDTNSPSPVKKRKGAPEDAPVTSVIKDDYFKGKTTIFSENDSPPPRHKRRRKRIDAELESTLLDPASAVPQPLQKEADVAEVSSTATSDGPRRSTRSRSSRVVALKPAAPSANSIALSMLPVRLSSSAELDRDMPAIVIPRSQQQQRNEEKDLAAVTRVNTRKNKGNSVPPRMVLARQEEDSAGLWRARELKNLGGGPFDMMSGYGDLDAEMEGIDVYEPEEPQVIAPKSGRRVCRAKGVRWAEELVRFQGDDIVPTSTSSSLPVDIAEDSDAELVLPSVSSLLDEEPPHVLAVKERSGSTTTSLPAETTGTSEDTRPSETDKVQPAAVTKKPAPRRASRLQMPTPVRTRHQQQSTVEDTKVPEKMVKMIPVPVGGPTSSKSAANSSSLAKTATRRSRIASLGMSGNGTPAPKRRATRGVV